MCKRMVSICMVLFVFCAACEENTVKDSAKETGDSGVVARTTPDAGVAQEPDMAQPASQPAADDEKLALDSGTWTLVSIGDKDQARPPVEGSTVTLVLEGGKLSGSFGCNQAMGTYDVPNEIGGPFPSIEIPPIAMTKKACLDEGGALMNQEGEIVKLLTSKPLFRFEDGHLVFFSEGKDLLRFKLADDASE